MTVWNFQDENFPLSSGKNFNPQERKQGFKLKSSNPCVRLEQALF